MPPIPGSLGSLLPSPSKSFQTMFPRFRLPARHVKPASIVKLFSRASNVTDTAPPFTGSLSLASSVP